MGALTIESKYRWTQVARTRRRLPPAVLLGGEANALSVARSLGRLGVGGLPAVNEPGACVRHSRHCRRLPVPAGSGEDVEDAWARFLLGPEADFLRGAVVLACSDAGIQLLARHREPLAGAVPAGRVGPGRPARACSTSSAPTATRPPPACRRRSSGWPSRGRQVLALRDELVFPLIVKPRLAHRAKKTFKHQAPGASRRSTQLLAACDAERTAAVDVLLMEQDPRPRHRLCSYYTYLDEDGNALFDFTKRIIRRYPAGMGLGCYHVTDWVPEIVEPARRLFRHAGLRGLANVEFKRDPRDGQYKLIECNARFTAADCLVAAAGIDLAAFVYRRAVGLPQPPLRPVPAGPAPVGPAGGPDGVPGAAPPGPAHPRRLAGQPAAPPDVPYFRWLDPMPALPGPEDAEGGRRRAAKVAVGRPCVGPPR